MSVIDASADFLVTTKRLVFVRAIENFKQIFLGFFVLREILREN